MMKGLHSPDGSLPPGLVLSGRYTISEHLHSGEMGGLYVVKDSVNEAKRYLKEFPPRHRRVPLDEELQKCFQRDVALLRELSQPNLPEVVDSFVSNGRCYILMCHVEGSTLRDILSGEGSPGLGQDRVEPWTIEILGILDSFHQREPSLIYFDITPETVKIDRDGHIVLLDFFFSGMLQIKRDEVKSVKERQSSKTVDRDELLRHDDLHSLGAAIYTILTGLEPGDEALTPGGKGTTSAAPYFEKTVMKLIRKEFSGNFTCARDIRDFLLKSGRRRAVPKEPSESAEPAEPSKKTAARSRKGPAGVTGAAKKTAPRSVRAPREATGTAKKTAPARRRGATVAPNKSGLLEWAFTSGGPILSSPAVENGLVYFGSFDTHLYCLHAQNGKEAWRFKTGWRVTSSPCLVGGYVYFGSCDNRLYCLNALDGTEIWRYSAANYVQTSPIVVDGFVYSGGGDMHLYCLDALTGKERWRYRANGLIESSPHVCQGRVFFGTGTYRLICLNAVNGTLIWELKGSSPVNSSPLVINDRIFFNTQSDGFFCADLMEGSVRWNFKTPCAWITMWLDSSPCSAGDLLYFGSLDHKVYCLEVETGRKKWEFLTEGKITSSPCVAGDYLYIGSDDGYLYCLSAARGARLWKFVTGHLVRSSPCVADGLLYFGSNDSKLYCINTGVEGSNGSNSVSRQGCPEP